MTRERNTTTAIGIRQTRLHFSSLQLSSFGEPVPNTASDFCSWLTEVEPDVVFCCCIPSTSRKPPLCRTKVLIAD
ncbi:hypothetical protein AMELA_G00032120 [Ameiurus melas]|uniref:Uncharacterized protein n=1 Tax=Ameiurus melas TaxID=219545 RepID=A0A7J6B7D2_AMEME|nr:hypothetical protein AMELA_G00032120 [Ameiurus melas]